MVIMLKSLVFSRIQARFLCCPTNFLSGCQRQGVQVVISLCSNVAGNSAICTGTVYWVRPRVSSWTHVDDEGRIKLVILLVFAVTHEGATDHR
jgi:hypothetical protein